MRRVLSLLVGAVLVGVMAWTAVDAFRLDLRHEVARATVVDVRSDKWTGTVDVGFTTGDGRSVQASVDGVWLVGPPDYRVGEQVGVEYDPAHPSRARIAGAHTTAATLVLLGALLAVVVSAEVGARRRRGSRA